ncbi:phosphoenolpyruvate synthase [Gloeobacter kilaueensis]|uniref:Phosphoenolpyruvate synthase n=1 Tax=Gloeobacter kilaueensis (strain ATCC BAA-2537 / CCAP 1431/1 / ULC 316 / JS1) TaxID=1183438 RepID=U5QMX7_GLOK1|nr:phosphoenolpyruvate synthase [Gloeobacter kilaueensis]AGY60258.1 phosphoenolpyruvate synthase [Gloeobacter kilaueensis JS1]
MVQTKRQNAFGPLPRERALVLWLDEVGLGDIEVVGGKNASLGELIRQLTPKGIRVPEGFAITAFAYQNFIHFNRLEAKLRALFADLDIEDLANLHERGEKARALIQAGALPIDLEAQIRAGYRRLCEQYGVDTDVAVRSSATAEDLPDASFAGQQESYLNIQGEEAVIAAVRRCYASLFTDRAISYRQLKGFDHFAVSLSVCVQKMVRSDLAGSGVIFSIDPESGFENAVLISAGWGLGEMVVQGAINPDEYIVFKPTLDQGFQPILVKRPGSKERKLVYADGDEGSVLLTVPTTATEQSALVLDDEEIVQLARWAMLIEQHYGRVRGVPTPMDIEWAKDGNSGELFIVQARPETVQSQKSSQTLITYRLTGRGPLLVSGRGVGEAVGRGKARIVLTPDQLESFETGEVLVTDRTDPDWEPVMKKASAIVTNQGGRTCHAAIIARELGIPAIVGTGDATSRIDEGQQITVACCEGDEGHVYAGLVPFERSEVALQTLPRPRTRILLNVGNPSEAFRLATAFPNDGVGLARLEFIIANQIQVHPLALLHFDELPEGEEKAQLAALTASYPHRYDYFVDRLTQGVATIAAAFYPKPVIVRLSDFKSNEYADLLGGRSFEPVEENPMLGWRGAARYGDARFRAAFALECRALKRVRDEMGLTNVVLMVPFCRTPEEGRSVIAQLASHGLVRGENGLEVYVMCELPSNVILAEQFAQIFDGFSIGSNDLTQLTLGLDRDSAAVAALFDERHPAVKAMIALAITTVKKTGRKIGICGQAPSDYPEFARWLVELGIDSMSLNPDAAVRTRLVVAAIEAEMTTGA